jgi:hypothetical protein
MRVWAWIATAVMTAPVAAEAASAPNTFLVTVSGTVTIDATIEREAVYEGGACKVTVVNKGHDTITYATVKPIRVALSGGKAAARVTVPYRYHLSGTSAEGTPTGTLPNGRPCGPLALPTTDCRTYEGDLALQLKVSGSTVTVSSTFRAYRPEFDCPGAHTIGIPPSSGKLVARPIAVVNGTGTQTSAELQIASQFQARFVSQ